MAYICLMTEKQKNNLSNNMKLIIEKLAIVQMQTKVIRKANLSLRTITTWKSGKQRPTIKTAQRVCDVLGLNIDDMINKRLEMELVFNIKFYDIEEEQ